MSFSLPLSDMSIADKLSVMELLWDELCRTPRTCHLPRGTAKSLPPENSDFETARRAFPISPQCAIGCGRPHNEDRDPCRGGTRPP